MKYYELSYLIPATLQEEELKTLKERIISAIQGQNGLLIEDNNFGKKRTAYLKGKERPGLLFSLNFEMNPEQLPDFEKKLKLENQILRYTVTIKKQQRLLRERPRIMPSVSRETERKAQPKVEMADIEKKLEEILGK
ncbi:MAG: 30S ribosomal protein S6 [Candidatus Nealsonbacteria bacterium]|nr:30S ribosomal protein S6 [Candidatus Nealsonbacteria bacterium]